MMRLCLGKSNMYVTSLICLMVLNSPMYLGLSFFAGLWLSEILSQEPDRHLVGIEDVRCGDDQHSACRCGWLVLGIGV